MKQSVIIVLFCLAIIPVVKTQENRYLVKKAGFSSSHNDEFSPVSYNNKLIFCSTLRDNPVAGYSTGSGKPFNMFIAEQNVKGGWKIAGLFARELTTSFNEGPVTFSGDNNMIYFARNNRTDKRIGNVNDTSNKMGLYKASFSDGIWQEVEMLDFCSSLYNYRSPSFDPLRKRLYFSSDMPGGFGKFDIWYSDLNVTGWSIPVNMGITVNTPGNDDYPFAAPFGLIYFASDGHKGFGGLDIYYTRETAGQYIIPAHLDSAINSPFDDFGFLTDSTLEKGWFSSDRLQTDDIFEFSKAPERFDECDSIKVNRYCFTFFDEQHEDIDTLPALYIWDFGGGIISKSPEAYHCFPGEGNYTVSLTILDEVTGDTISEKVTYEVQLKNIAQPVIRTDDLLRADTEIRFSGEVADLKDIVVTDYFWNFGDGFKPGSPEAVKTFRRRGIYEVRLGVTGRDTRNGSAFKGCVWKKIEIK